MSNTNKFAAYNEQAIFGIGATAEAAIDAARNGAGVDAAIVDVSAYKTAQMTERLAARVEMSGGDVAFDYNRETRMLDLAD